MIKLSNHKESICFNFENDEQKKFFEKAKKCDIIHNNNSIFLRRILSVKNQSLLNQTLKQSKSQIFKHINTLTYDSNNLNINTNNYNSNLSTIPNKTKNSYNNILSPQICLDEINFNNSFQLEISPKKVLSPKIIVNKNKNLRFHSQKEKENIKEPSLLTDNTIFSEKDNISIINNERQTFNSNIKEKYGLNTINTDYNINPEINFSNLYTKNYIRKPVVIKFENCFNHTNVKEKNNKNDKDQNLFDEENKENIPDNNQRLKKMKTESKIKPYNFYNKNNLETELYRSFEDLEKKSLEISKRKMKKNSICIVNGIKKEHNLEELKESLENYRIKTRNNLKRKKMKKENFINHTEKNIIKNDSIKLNNKKSNKIINSNKNKISEYNFNIKKPANIISDNVSHWHRQKNKQNNDINFNDYKPYENKRSNISHIPKVKSEELLINNQSYENTKKKSIKINFIEENKTENIYNITLNTNNVNEAFNRFHVSVNYDHNFKYKNFIIRQKYGKKHNINERSKIQNNNKNIIKDSDKNTSILRKFIGDNKTKNYFAELKHCQSHSLLPNNQTEVHIKVNKKNNSGKKLVKLNSFQKNINPILDLEDKINSEINKHLQIINGIEKMNEFVTNYNKKFLKKKFILLCNYYNQIGTINNTTLLTNISHLSEMKYVKKIVQKENDSKKAKGRENKKLMRHKSFNSEKQRILLIKRKEFGFFEKYEHCLDFINNLRILLIKYSSNNKKYNL